MSPVRRTAAPATLALAACFACAPAPVRVLDPPRASAAPDAAADQGHADAGPTSADATVASTDGGEPSQRDGGLASADAATCTEAIAWVEPGTLAMPIERDVTPSLRATEEGFALLYQHATFEACDGPCPMLLQVGPRGGDVRRNVTYWSSIFAPERLYSGDTSDGPVFAMSRGPRLAWVRGAPAPNRSWTEGASAELPLDPNVSIADLVFIPGTRAAALATHRTSPRSSHVTFTDLSVREVFLEATLAMSDTPLAVDPFGSFDHWALALGADATGAVWTAGLQDWDFPPAVQLASTRESFATVGSSCGVSDFALRPGPGRAVTVLEGCGGDLVLEERAPSSAPELPRVPAVTLATDRFAEAPSPVALAPLGDRWIAAYWRNDGALGVVLLSSARAVIARGTVPRAAFFWAETFPGPLALATHRDGTVAIAWTTSLDDGGLDRLTIGCDDAR